jgi:hypothetical protein
LDTDLIDRLDHLIALYELVNAGALRDARAAARADKVTSTVLDLAVDWTGAGALKTTTATAHKTSEKTAQRRISELLAQRAIASRWYEGALQYKSTGLI